MSKDTDKRRRCECLEDLYKQCTQVFHPGLKGGLLLKDMDANPTDPAIKKMIKVFKNKNFTAMRDLARELGVREDELKAIYADKNKTAAMTDQIAKLQV